MLEGWNIIRLKGGMHSSVCNTKTFLYDIRELRYKQIKITISDIRSQYLKCLKSDIPFWFAYISASWYGTEIFLYFRRCYGSHFSNEICPSLLACLLPEKLCKHQISRHKFVQYLSLLKSDIPFWFADISASWYRTEIFFVLQTELWIPLFKWNMSQPSSMFVAREIKQKLRRIFVRFFLATL